MRYKVDWQQIKKEYFDSDEISVSKFLENKEMNPKSGNVRKATKGWQNEKKQILEQAKQKIQDIKLEAQKNELEAQKNELEAQILKSTSKIVTIDSLLDKLMIKIEEKIEEKFLTVDSIKKITSSLKDIKELKESGNTSEQDVIIIKNSMEERLKNGS